MDIGSLQRIERMNYILGGVLIAASVFVFTREGIFGVAVGVILSGLNFTVMRYMVQRWLASAARSQSSGARSNQALLMFPKMALLMLAIFLAIWYLPISAIGVAIGFSVFLVSIGVETVRFLHNHSASGDASASE
jgi:hypothetical protein